MIVLNEVNVDAGSGKGVRIPAFHEKATVITKDCGFDEQWARNVALDDVHVSVRRDIQVRWSSMTTTSARATAGDIPHNRTCAAVVLLLLDVHHQ